MTAWHPDSGAVAEAFDRICVLVAAQRRGFTLRDLAGVHALARELNAPTPRRAHLEELATDLGIELEDLEGDALRRVTHIGRQLELPVGARP